MIREEYFLPYVLENNRLFLDIETTGLSPVDNEIVIINYASYFNDKKCKIVQLISQDIQNDEKTLINQFITDTLGNKILLTFNGDEFEEKFLSEKMKKYKMDFKFDFSSLKSNIRHFGKYLKISSFSRENIENYFDISKERYYNIHKIVKSMKKESIVSDDLIEHSKEEIKTLIEIHLAFDKIKKGKKAIIKSDSFYLDDFDIVGDIVNLQFITSKKYSYSEFFLENGEKLTLNSDKVIITIVAKSLKKGENSMILYETDKEYLPLFINDDIIFENIFFILGMYTDNI
jgi:hypothetical protein